MKKLYTISILLVFLNTSGFSISKSVKCPNKVQTDQSLILSLDSINQITEEDSSLYLIHPRYSVSFAPFGITFKPKSKAPVLSWQMRGVDKALPKHINDKVVYNHGSISEEYILKNNVIEQQFVLSEWPSGSKVVRVEGAITSNATHFTKANGHWIWSNGYGQVTFSDVFAFDSKGNPIPANMVVTESSSIITIQLEDIKHASFPVTIDPEIGTDDYEINDIPVGTEADLTIQSTDPAISYSESLDQYLVVWEKSEGGESEIFGQLLDSKGSPAGTEFLITEVYAGDARDATDPDVACIGSEFLVVWRTDDNYTGITLEDNEFEIVGRLITIDAGSPSLSDYLRISDMGGTDEDPDFRAESPAIVSNQTGVGGIPEFLIVWAGDDDSGSLINEEFEIYGQRIRLEESVISEIGTNDFRVSDMGPDGFSELQARSPDVTWNSTNNQYMVVWSSDEVIVPQVDNEYEIYFQLLTSSGAQTGSNDVRLSFMGTNGSTSFGAFSPSITYNDTDNTYHVVWYGDDDSGSLEDDEFEIYSVIISNNGTAGSISRISDMGTDGSTSYGALNPVTSYDPNLDLFLVAWQGDDNTGSLINNEIEIWVQVLDGDGTESGSDIRLSQVGGTGNTTYNASDAAISYGGTMREFVTIWEADAVTDSKFAIWGHRFAEVSDQPATQATSFASDSRTENTFTVSFTEASGSPDGYIVIRKTDSSPTDIPDEQTYYEIGETIGSSTVAYIGSDLTFDESGLTANTTYYYDIFSYNGVNSSTNYYATSPLEGNVTTLASEPTTQASSLIFSNVETSEVTIDFTDGNGSSRLVVAKEDGAVDVFPVDGNSYSENNVFGSGDDLGSSNYVVGTGSGPITVTGLSTFTTYHFQVFEFNGSGGLENYQVASDTDNPNAVTTLSSEPTSQPTDLSLSNLTDISLSAAFTAASGSPDGYIVLSKEGSAPASTPVDGTTYVAGNTLGDATVVSTGSEISFDDTELSPATDYYYAIYSFNGSGSTVNYLETTPLEGNTTTYEAEPSTQASALLFSTLETTSITVDFIDGNGTSRLLVMKEGSAVDQTPSDGSSYTANAVFGDGDDLGSSNFIVGIGSGPITVTGLSEATEYHLKVFEFDGSGGLENYNLSDVSGNPASIATLTTEPTDQPTSLTFETILASTISASFTAGAGPPDGYLVLMKSGASPTGMPADGTSYVAGNSIGDGTVVSVASGTTFDASSLSAATEYYFAIFSYNGTGANTNYLATSPLEGNAFTLAEPPGAQATSLLFSNITPSSMEGSFTTATGTPDGYLVLRKAGSAPGEMPVNGNTYAANDNLGTSTVAFVGSLATFANESLNPDTQYFYAVYTYNGTGVSTHYLIADPLTGSQTTRATEPGASPTNLLLDGFTTTSMNGSFTGATSDGYLVLRRITTSPTETPVDGTSYSIDEILGNSTVIHAGSATTFSSTGLEAGRVYRYDVFSYNGSGSSLNYKITDPLENNAITISPTPVLLDPAQIASSSFSASWNASTGAASYALDVSLDNFATYVNGYEALVVTGGLEESVTGLNPETAYKYRVRAVNASGVSENSLEKSVTTLEAGGTVDTDPPIVTNPTGVFGAALSATVSDGGSGVAAAILFYKPISETDFEFIELTAGSGNSFTVNTQDSWADELGMEGYIIAEDVLGNTTQSPPHFFLYRSIPQDAIIPFAGANFNGKTSTYRMFSIPYDLGNNNLLSDVFSDALGEQNEDIWRVFHYNAQPNYVELSTSSRIDLGNAYWFNTTREDFTIEVDEGMAVHITQQTPYTKNYRTGWNQIGNPYPFEISWADIQAANPDRILGAAQTFSNGSYQTATILAPWEGAFVFCETGGTVSFPLSSKSSARVAGEDPDKYLWSLEMELSLGGISQMSMVGMAIKAKEGKDHLDEIAVPRFIDYLEMTTDHPEFFAPKFTQDIVPETDQYEWNFELNSNQSAGQAELKWDSEILSKVEGTCFLLNPVTLQVIDMSQSSTFKFDWQNGKKLKIIYSANGIFKTTENLIGNIYPNPFNSEVIIPILVANKEKPLNIKVFNLSGQKIYEEIKLAEGLGKQYYTWNGQDSNGNEIADGLYLINIDFSEETKTMRVIKSSQP